MQQEHEEGEPCAPYRVEDSHLSLEDVLRQNSEDCFLAACGRVNPLRYYADLLNDLAAMPRCDIRPMRDFMQPVKPGNIVLGLRHDVDHDIVTARAMSALEARLGLCGSYYLLHSHPFVGPGYYSLYDIPRRTMLRNACLARVYREMQAGGSEIGLHVDAVRLFQNGLDGYGAIVAELHWLRSVGLVVTGGAAHGSFSSDQVENFEFFAEYHTGYRDSLVLQGRRIPLGRLSARSLGLQYEANYCRDVPPRDAAQVEEYARRANTEDVREHLRWYLHANPYCVWGTDYTCWVYGKDTWAIAATSEAGPFIPATDSAGVCAFIAEVPEGSRVVLHVHPFYVGERDETTLQHI